MPIPCHSVPPRPPLTCTDTSSTLVLPQEDEAAPVGVPGQSDGGPPLATSHAQLPSEKSSSASVCTAPIQICALQSKFRQHSATWLLAFVTASSLAVSTWIIYLTFISTKQVPSYLYLSQGHTVTLVNVLSHFVSYLVWQLLGSAFEALRWAMAARTTGIPVPSFLSMSRATGLLGVLDLLRVPGCHTIWGVQRLLYKTLCFLMSLVLLNGVTYTTLFIPDTSSVVNVTAGIAQFNAFTVAALVGPSQIKPALIDMYYLMYTENILRDTTTVTSIAPISCSGSNCTSIYLPGGINLVRLTQGGPNATLFGAELPDGPVFLVNEAPGYQLEFFPISDGFMFNSTKDCTTYGGSNNGAINICFAAKGMHILAGWSICPSDLYVTDRCLNDTSWTDQPDESTVLMLHKRYSTVAYDRTNLSIVSIESISDPIPPTETSTFEVVQNLTFAMDLVLSPISNSLNTSDPNFPTSAMTYSVEYIFGWALRLYQDDYKTYPGGPLSVLEAFLTVPLQFSTTAWQWGTWETLPNDLRTTASLASSEKRTLGSFWMLVVFTVTAGVLIFWATIVLAWVCIWGSNCPNTSRYPELDIVVKARMAGADGKDIGEARDLEGLARQSGMGNGVSSNVRCYFRGQRLFVGAVEGRVVLATERGRIENLNVGQSYC